MLFDACKTSTKQGDIGEARAIYEYTKRGYVVSSPLHDSAKYDLIVDDGTKLSKVQVKTSKLKFTEGAGYQICLPTGGGNTKVNTRRKPEAGDYDELFVLTEDGECWIIPASVVVGRSTISVGSTKYNEYKLMQ